MQLTLEELGSAASLLGLLVSLWVLFKVWHLKAGFLARARLPQLRNHLRHLNSELSRLLGGGHANRPRIRETLAKMEPVVKSITKKIPRQSRSPLERTLQAIRTVRERQDTADEDFHRVYTDVLGVLQQLTEHLADQQWEMAG